MLSKKMAFSLMSLITIFALAFAVPSAMAEDDFDATFSVADTTYATAIEVTLAFGEEVNFTDANRLTVAVQIENMNGVRRDLSTDLVATDFTDKDINLAVTGDQADRKTFKFTIDANETTEDDRKVHLHIPAGVARLVPEEEKTSKEGSLTFDLIGPIPVNADRPNVVSIQRLRPGSQTVVSAFEEAEVTGAFDVRIVFTELPRKAVDGEAFALDDIEVDGGTASNLVVGVPFTQLGDGAATSRPHPLEGMYLHSLGATVPAGVANMGNVPDPTGDDEMYHQYRVTITPHRRVDMVKISIKEFHDNDVPFPNVYKPFNVANKPNGREQLRLAVATNLAPLGAGFMFYLPHANDAFITYAGTAGHYILTKDKAGSGIDYSEEKDDPDYTRVENVAHKQTPAQLLYNVRASGSLPNLETFLANNGTIDLVSYGAHAAGSAYISEVMWGTDASQDDDATKSQWIEIANGTSAAIAIGEKVWALWFYQANETPRATYVKDDGTAGVLIDRIGTKTFAGTVIAPATTGTTADIYWSIAGKGQSGRSGVEAGAADVAPVAPIQKIISMYRVMVPSTAVGAVAGAMMPGGGTMAASWMQSAPPSVNFKLGLEGRYDASPGSTRVISPSEAAAIVAAAKAKAAAAAAAAAKAADTSVSMPMVGKIYISEIMFAGGGTLPQWIEISNGSRSEEVDLSGWTLTVDNAAADTDVSVGSVTFEIPKGTKIDMSGQDDTPSTLLLVTERGRNNLTGAKARSQVMVLNQPGSTTEIDLIIAGVLTPRYSLLSGTAFKITLAPPVPIEAPAKKAAAPTTAAEIAAARAAAAAKAAADAKAAQERAEATDIVGNLGADGAAAWALPMSEDGRSSIIRGHVQVSVGAAEPEDGTMMMNWALASDTSFAQPTHIRAASYYGAQSDVGTPGFRPGGALPVELSHFRPARNKETGAVVITWSTQSELNNAGFFIKRSQQKDGEFKIINAAMIAGAGTTSEKQFYTYTDTTAQPNVVYYYQIEDVSLDGNRQTLTRGMRLKGHVSVAGKATLTWGELKTSQ